jgi:acyl-CoA dehydrogenase
MAAAQSIHANVYATQVLCSLLWNAHANFGQPVARFGTEEQRTKLLPKVVKGESRICFGV